MCFFSREIIHKDFHSAAKTAAAAVLAPSLPLCSIFHFPLTTSKMCWLFNGIIICSHVDFVGICKIIAASLLTTCVTYILQFGSARSLLPPPWLLLLLLLSASAGRDFLTTKTVVFLTPGGLYGYYHNTIISVLPFQQQPHLTR